MFTVSSLMWRPQGTKSPAASSSASSSAGSSGGGKKHKRPSGELDDEEDLSTDSLVVVAAPDAVQARRREGVRTLWVAGLCEIGGKKKEDRSIFGIKVWSSPSCPERDVYCYGAVDGHGGEGTAEYLKSAVPAVLTEFLKERVPLMIDDNIESDPVTWQNVMKDVFAQCADEWDNGPRTPARRKCGAVATVLLVQNRLCIIAHVGDCRVVAATPNACAPLTSDHRASNEEERKRVEALGGRVSNGRVKGVLAPSRSFGDIAVRTGDDGVVHDYIRAEPDLTYFHVDLDGFLILSSDGVSDSVSSEESVDIVRLSLQDTKGNVERAAHVLAEIAAMRNEDDVTAIVLVWGGNGQ